MRKTILDHSFQGYADWRSMSSSEREPTRIHWGVDSAVRADFPIPSSYRGDGPSGETLYDLVTRRAGQAPSFWGRYLGAFQLTRTERDYLLDKGCRILLVYSGPRGVTRNQAGDRQITAGYRVGRRSAERAIRIARYQVDAPSGVRIYADLERWHVNPDWMRGWCDAMQASEYAGMGGFYGKPVRVRESPDLIQYGRPPRMRQTVQRGPLGSEIVDEAWGPSFTAASTHLGQTGLSYDDLELEALMLHGPGHALEWSRYIWSNEPMMLGDPPADRLRPQTFSPVPPSGGGDVVVWQYRQNVYRTRRFAIDMNLADDRGFNDMWH